MFLSFSILITGLIVLFFPETTSSQFEMLNAIFFPSDVIALKESTLVKRPVIPSFFNLEALKNDTLCIMWVKNKERKS